MAETLLPKALKLINERGGLAVDIGGGLRIEKSNRTNASHAKFIDKSRVEYKVLDKFDTYHPDIVGDVQNLPLKDESVDAFFCVSLLENVEEPQKAMKEIFRSLKKGGYCYGTVPFIRHFGPMPGYYNDFYRFTKEGLKYLVRDFAEVEIVRKKGPLTTLIRLIPRMGKVTLFEPLDDRFFANANLTTGYEFLCRK
jgi:SAM-dependent methyltransferase